MDNMSALGPIFTNVQRVHGPVLIAAQPTKGFTLLGEVHFVNGTPEPNEHVLELIESYAKAHPNVRIKIMFEAKKDEVYTLRNAYAREPSPRKVLGKRILNKVMMPEGFKIWMGCSHRDMPFHIFEVLYDFETFAMRHVPKYGDINTIYHQAQINSRILMKALFNRMKTRDQCINMVKSLIDPDVNVPKWLLPHFARLGISETDTPIKDTLSRCKKNDGNNTALYVTVMRMVNDMFLDVDHTLSIRQQFLIALRNIERHIYTLTHMHELKESHDHVIFLTDVDYLTKFMDVLDTLPSSTPLVYAFDASGDLNTSDVVAGSIKDLQRSMKVDTKVQQLYAELAAPRPAPKVSRVPLNVPTGPSSNGNNTYPFLFDLDSYGPIRFRHGDM